MQPGDNFAIAASTDQNQINAVGVSGTDLLNGSGQGISTSCDYTDPVCRSEMLTVWRRLHIEVDSMGEAQQNFVLGTIPNETKIRPNTTVTITVNPSPNNPLEANRFEGGRLVVDGTSLPVVCDIANGIACNTATTVRVQNTGSSIINILAGSMFQLYDDDDFNDNDGTNVDGDTGEDITEPDTALLTVNSDDINTNVFASAYVRPVYDIVDPRDNSFFQANVLSSLASDIRPLFVDRDAPSSTNIDNEFWTVFVLGSYQHRLARDGDPNTENFTAGIVDEITTVFGENDDEGSGALIFMEVHRTRELPQYNPNPSDVTSLANTVAHEVGHLFSGQHGDRGLMGDADGQVESSVFSPTTLRRIRILQHP